MKTPLQHGALALALLLGCGDDDDSVQATIDSGVDATTQPPPTGDVVVDAGSDGAVATPEPLPPTANPLYAVQATVNNADESSTSYVALVPTLDATQTIDYARTLEIPAGAGIFGPEQGGYFLVGRSDEPTLQRYDVNEKNEFKPGAKLSLANLGASDTWAGSDYGYVYSPTSAFYVAAYQGRYVIEFNPTTMTITRKIETEGLALPASPDTVKITDQSHARPRRVGDKIYIPAVYRGNADDVAYPKTAVAILNMANGELTYVRDDRCGPAIVASMGGDGYLYLSSWLWRYNTVSRPATPEACLLRIDLKTDQIDPSFSVKTKAVLGGGREVSSIVFGRDGTPFTRVFHPELFPYTPTMQSYEPGNSKSWRWMKLPRTLDGVGTELDGELGGAWVAPFFVAGETYVQENSEDNGTTFYSLSSEGVTKRINMRGFTWGIVKVR